MPTSDERHQVDIAWFRHHLLDEILPAWRAAITAEGLFTCHFDVGRSTSQVKESGATTAVAAGAARPAG